MHIFLALFFILLFPVQAFSQDNLSSFVGQKITSIMTISPTGITDRDIEKECGIKKGDIISGQLISECISYFYKKGLFKDIIVEADMEWDGAGLQFTFVGKTRLGKIKIKGNDYFSTKILKNITGLKKGDELTDDLISDIRDRIIDLYRGSGFFEAAVKIDSIYSGKNQTSDLLLNIDEGKRTTIGKIIFIGERVLDDEILSSVMKLHDGDYYNEKDMDSSIKNLEKIYLENGYLKVLIYPPDLVYEKTNGKITVIISIEAGPAVEVFFEGIEVMDKDTIKKELIIWKERSFDSAVLDESSDRLMQYYKSNGYYLVKVTYSTEKSEKDIRITFKISEGVPVSIEEIIFSGNSYFKEKRLKKILQTEEGKFLTEEVIEEDINNLIKIYKNNGFLDIKITPEAALNEKDMTLSIKFVIDEGIQTYITNIILDGNNTFSREEIIRNIKSNKGQPFNESQVIDDLYSIQSFYVQKGYIYSRVVLNSKFSDDKKEVIIDYSITEDNPVYIGEISISGNSFTMEYVIRRELLIKEGDLYNYENILRSQRRLLMLGFFRNIKIEPVNPEVKEYTKDISVNVEEGYPGTVEFGVGYGDIERFRGVFETSYRNILGTGRQISLSAEGSSIEQKYGVGYKEPWVLGYQMDARFNVVDLIENKISFNRRTLGITTGIDKSFSDYVKSSVMYQYEDVKLSDVSEEAQLTSEDTGKVKVATINPSLIIDRRDDPFNPSKGAFYSLSFREAAKMIGSKPQFAKVNLQSSFYSSPVSKIVIALSGRGGTAWNFGESTEVPVFERYFLGGRSTLRGYEQERLGIPGKTIKLVGNEWNPTGGNMMMVLNGEIRFNLFKGFGLVTFIDSGNVWRELDEFNISEIKSTAGGGIRYNTPVGPLRLDIGCKLNPEVNEDKCLPHFTLGHAF